MSNGLDWTEEQFRAMESDKDRMVVLFNLMKRTCMQKDACDIVFRTKLEAEKEWAGFRTKLKLVGVFLLGLSVGGGFISGAVGAKYVLPLFM